MDVDRSGPGVEDAAVAVAALNQRPHRVLHSPRVLGCGGGGSQKNQHKTSIIATVKLIFTVSSVLILLLFHILVSGSTRERGKHLRRAL